MKNLVLGLVGYLAIAGMAKGDVVAFYNTSSANGTASANLALTFNADVSGLSITGFKLFGTHQNIQATQLTATFSGDGSVGSKTITSSTLTDGAFYFDLSGSTGWGAGNTGFQNLNATGYLMQIQNITAVGGGTSNLFDTTGSSTITSNTAYGFSGAAYYTGAGAVPTARFEVYTVPEPGTLLLGGIAACSGAAGAWWKRRKRKTTQPETADQPATA